jgi:putative membrane protein
MPTQPLQNGADRRTQLAADRTVFAAERTYAAWVRTGLAALASGVGAKKLLEGVIPEWGIWGVGTVLVLFSAFCFGAAIWRQLFPGPPPPEPDTPKIPPWLLVVVNGLPGPRGAERADQHLVRPYRRRLSSPGAGRAGACSTPARKAGR